MKINKFLSLVVAGMLAVTTAATGAISLPGGVAKAAAVNSDKITITKGGTNVTTTGIDVASSEFVTLSASCTEGPNLYFKYSWTLTSAVAGKYYIYDGGVAKDAYDGGTGHYTTAEVATNSVVIETRGVDAETATINVLVKAYTDSACTVAATNDYSLALPVNIKVPAFTNTSPQIVIVEQDVIEANVTTVDALHGDANGSVYSLYNESADGVDDWFCVNTVNRTYTAMYVDSVGGNTVLRKLDTRIDDTNFRLYWTGGNNINVPSNTPGNTTCAVGATGTASSSSVSVKVQKKNGTNWVDTAISASLTVAISAEPTAVTVKSGNTTYAGGSTITLDGDTPITLNASAQNTNLLPSAFSVGQNFRWVADSDTIQLDNEYGSSVTITALANVTGATVTCYAVDSKTYNPTTKINTAGASATGVTQTFTINSSNVKVGLIYDVTDGIMAGKSVNFSAHVNDGGFGTTAGKEKESDLNSANNYTAKKATYDAEILYMVSSSNTNVFTVDTPLTRTNNTTATTYPVVSGKITGVSDGTATLKIEAIYYANATDKKTITEEITITVGSGANAKLDFSASNYSVAVGATTTAVATPTNLTGGTLTYSSADTKIATISAAGVVTGVAVGSTTITATYTLNAKIYTATATVTVSAPSTVVLDRATYSVSVGGTARALATATGGTPVYSISDPSIATVNASTGLITGIKAGTVILTATVGTSKATAYVVVSSVKVTLDQSEYTVAAGSAIQAIATSTSGTPVFSVSDTSIATVNATTGVITGIKTGTVILTATVGTEKATAIVTVTGSTPEPVIPSVEEFDYGEGTFELTSDGEATFTGTEKKSGTVAIPAYVYYKVGSKSYTYKVTFIDDGAFRKSKVKKVKVGANVKGIGYKAFAKCRNLEKVAFEDASNIEVIEDKAFNNTKDGCILKQKNGNKFDSEIKSWLEKTFKQLVIK